MFLLATVMSYDAAVNGDKNHTNGGDGRASYRDVASSGEKAAACDMAPDRIEQCAQTTLPTTAHQTPLYAWATRLVASLPILQPLRVHT